MAKIIKEFAREAKAAPSKIGLREAYRRASGRDLILDERGGEELPKDRSSDGAVRIPRGVLERNHDPRSDSVDKRLTGFHGSNRPEHVLCASGVRAALAARRLIDTEYRSDSIAGGPKGWKEAGLPVQDGQGG